MECWNQLAVDTTLVSPLTREGVPRQRGGDLRRGSSAGCSSQERATYPELLRSRRCKLVVVGLEVGGGWSREAASFTTLLAQHKARQTPPTHPPTIDIVDAQLPPIAMRAAAGRAISAVQRHPALLVIHEHAP